MTKSAIRTSLENKRLKLTVGQMESHYSIVLVFFIPYLILLFILVKDLITGTSTTTHPDFQNVIIGGTVLGIIAFWFQRRRLNLIELDWNPTEEQFQELLRKIEERQDWQVIHNSKRAIIIKTFPKLTSGSWGEQITILRDGTQTFVNSICDPDNISSVFSAGRNTSNVESIKNMLKNPIANNR